MTFSWPEVMSFLDKAREKLVRAGLITDKESEPTPTIPQAISAPKPSSRPASCVAQEAGEGESKDAAGDMPESLRKELVKSAFKKVWFVLDKIFPVHLFLLLFLIFLTCVPFLNK